MELNDISSVIIQAAINVHKELGLLINFNEKILKNGITRIINTPVEK